MRRFFRVLIRLGLVVVGATLVEGCLNRDPGVALGRGYEISAISPGSPCYLSYSTLHDEERKDSGWLTFQRDHRYVLSNLRTGEHLSFDSKEQWRAAIREKKAPPPSTGIMYEAEGITGFKCDSSFIIGQFQDGYFILDMEDGAIQTYVDKAPWAQAVAAQTQLTPDGLLNPRSWWLVERHWTVWAAHIIFLLLALPWAIWPAFARRRARGVVEWSECGEKA